MPGSPGHLRFVSSIASLAKRRGKKVGILFLQHDLMPQTRYPHQLRQAVGLLRYAVTQLGKRPSKIMLASDSAGGNLLLGVLGHLSHPHPEIEPLHMSESLRAAVMSSPWTNLYCTGESYTKNFLQDPVLPSTISMWAKTYLGDAPEDNYNYPSKAPTSWWENMQVQEILIVGGGDEMMRADIQKLGKDIKVSVHMEAG